MIHTENKYQNTSQIDRLEKEIAELEAANQPTPPRDELSDKEKTFEKRYGDLRRHSQKREDDLKKELADLKAQVDAINRKGVDFPETGTQEELEAWAQKYPDVYKKILRIANTTAHEATKTLQEKLQAQEARELDRVRIDAYKTLLQLHPDFDELKDTDEFQEWASRQPDWIYNALYNNDTDAHAAARAIDLFKMDNGKAAPKVSKPKVDDSARSVRTASPSPTPSGSPDVKFTESSVEKMSWREFEKHEKEINEAMKDSRFYDLSGAAR